MSIPKDCADSPSLRTDAFWMANHPHFEIKTIHVDGHPRKVSFDPRCGRDWAAEVEVSGDGG